jgi:hypothetical protein
VGGKIKVHGFPTPPAPLQNKIVIRNLKAKGLGHGSSGTALAYRVEDLEYLSTTINQSINQSKKHIIFCIIT